MAFSSEAGTGSREENAFKKLLTRSGVMNPSGRRAGRRQLKATGERSAGRRIKVLED
jgi:hypothetical protein